MYKDKLAIFQHVITIHQKDTGTKKVKVTLTSCLSNRNGIMFSYEIFCCFCFVVVGSACFALFLVV